MIETGTLWTVIIGLGIGSYALRFAFLGIVGDRPKPPWLLRPAGRLARRDRGRGGFAAHVRSCGDAGCRISH